MTSVMRQGLDGFFDQITGLGGMVFYVLVTLLFIGEPQIFWGMLLSVGVVLVICSGIKAVYHKERPRKQQKNNWYQRLDAMSFPSLHAMRAFSLVFWLSLFVQRTTFTLFASTIALLIIISRVYMKKHYVIDVVGGVLLSVIVNLVIWGLV